MKGLSVILFSRNYPERTIGAIRDIYKYVDEIILVDSSEAAGRKELLVSKRENKWNKLKIYYMVPLGFVELYRSYAINKCSRDWVLYLDVDERVSDKLKKDIKNITRTSRCSAYNVVRYEDVAGEIDHRKFSFQVRLFRKSNVQYRGIIDERPIVDGKLCRFDSDIYYIMHVLEQMRHQFNEYYKPENKFSKYELLSYHDYNTKMLSYLARVRGIKEEDIRTRPSARYVIKLLNGYELITFRKPSQEISTFDYSIFTLIRLWGLSYKQRNWRGMLNALPTALKVGISHLKYKMRPHHNQTYEISRIINEIGMIKFLGLDNEIIINKINKKYKDEKLAGLGLLSHLLEQRYAVMKGKGEYP